jgi:molybdate transport system substrate-binding protein
MTTPSPMPIASAAAGIAAARAVTAVAAVAGLALSGALLLFACTRDEPSASSTAPPAPPQDRSLTVFAAASLREAFTALGADFERAQPGLSITFNFAGSQELRTQLEHGAPADVFASADARHMDELVRSGRASAPTVFARNEPIVIVSTEAAGSLRALADLPSAERVVIGTAEVPIGRYTLQILDRAGATLGRDFRARVEEKVVSHELNVKHVLSKVRLGEAQAGVVYRTDARAVPDVTIVTIPDELNVVAEYPIAVVTGAPNADAARAFVALVLSDAGQEVLRHAGFVAPRAEEER